MKKQLFYLLLLILTAMHVTVSHAQQYKIMKAASRYFMDFAVLYDKQTDDVFGYIELSRSIRPAKLKEKVYYTILDKNLNKITDGQFDIPVKFKKSFVTLEDISFADGHILMQIDEKLKQGIGNNVTISTLNSHYHILSVGENKIIKHGKLADLIKTKKSKRVNLYMATTQSAPRGFIINMLHGSPFSLKQTLVVMDVNGNVLWDKFHALYLAKKKKSKSENVLGVDKDYVYMMSIPVRLQKSNHYDPNVSLIVRKWENGEQLAKTGIKPDPRYRYKIFYNKTKNGNIIFSGRYMDIKKSKSNRWLGIFRDIYVWDGKELKRNAIQYLPFTQFKVPGINEYGKIKKEGYLTFEDVDHLDDGRMIYIAESHNSKTYRGLYLFLMDKDFHVAKSKKLMAEPTSYAKYRFSHKLQHNKGRFFVFYDEDGKYSYNIHIIKYLTKEDKFSERVLKGNYRKSKINVVPAKKGYIMIIEKYNNPKKEGKLMELRLEKV